MIDMALRGNGHVAPRVLAAPAVFRIFDRRRHDFARLIKKRAGNSAADSFSMRCWRYSPFSRHDVIPLSARLADASRYMLGFSYFFR